MIVLKICPAELFTVGHNFYQYTVGWFLVGWFAILPTSELVLASLFPFEGWSERSALVQSK